MNTQLSSRAARLLPFEIVKEAWCDFGISDGTRIRVRPILLRALVPEGFKFDLAKSEQALALEISQKVLVVVLPPAELRGERNRSPPSVEAARGMPQEDRRIDFVTERWSTYSLNLGPAVPEVRLQAKIVPGSVTRVTGVWNEEGDPYYVVNYATLIGVGGSAPTPRRNRPAGKRPRSKGK